ncbi:hypothetical protein PIB30_013784 [Stylosanthes scabra]|uniref:Uncharacterized protein n=1 Tax=Stylosanthes scabra TaxID=79078 RepID=A0ABU6Q776_9FABA|nr:hypothetical protein [Stylosanthes scabra]
MTNKPDMHYSFEGQSDVKSLQSLDDDKNDDIQSQRNEGPDVYSSPAAGSLSQTEVSFPIYQPGILKHKLVDEVMVSDEERKPKLRIKSNTAHILNSEGESGKHGDKAQNVKGKKLVINLGSRKINMANASRFDTSSCQTDQDMLTINGNDNIIQVRKGDKFASDRPDGASRRVDGTHVNSGQSKHLKVSGREENFIKLGKLKPEVSEFSLTSCRGEGNANVEAIPRGERTYHRRPKEGNSDAYDGTHENNNQTPSHSLPKDSKPLLRLKFKTPSVDSQNSTLQEEEKTTIKGQKLKRKRSSPVKEKASFNEAGDVNQSQTGGLMDEIMDANWILIKLGNDAIGKKVEVHQTSDNSWHKGEVTDIVEGSSKLYVTLDDGKVKTVELRKQGVRFVSHKQKRSKT